MANVDMWLIANSSYDRVFKEYLEARVDHKQGHECDGHCIARAEGNVKQAKKWLDDCFREYVRNTMKEETQSSHERAER